MVDVVIKGLRFVSEAARTNWYGLGCPAYCTQPSLSFPVLTALIGFCLGVIGTLYGLWLLVTFGFLPPSSSTAPPATNRYLALAGYLHERGSRSRRRN